MNILIIGDKVVYHGKVVEGVNASDKKKELQNGYYSFGDIVVYQGKIVGIRGLTSKAA